METYLNYTGKAAIAAGAFYIAFLLLFQNQKHFTFNRIYLPVSLALSFVIPLITFTTIKYIEPVTISDSGSFAYLPAPNEIPQQPAFVFEWYHYLFGLYLLGTAGFLFHLLLGHLKAINIIQKSRVQKIFNYMVNITPKDVHPFSFFSKIVVSEKILSHPDLEIIVSHENIHVREKHTLDILFTEIMFLLQWFNPFAWLLKDAVKNNLEYITDNEIAKHYNPQTYQLAMVTLADKQGIAPFLTALNGSQLKNRIVMMKKKTENKYAFVKQLVVLPLLAVLVMGLSNKVEKTELIHEDPQTIEIKNSDSSNFRVIIDGEVIPTNTPEMQQLNLEEVLDVPASANNFNSLGKISREILKVQNINPAKIEGTHYAGRFPDVSTLFILTTDYVEGTNLEFEKHMNRDSSRTIADNYIKSKIAEDNILRFEDFKIIVDGKEISTDKPEFKNIKLTEENNYNGRIAVEIIEALNIDLNDIRSSKSSSNSPNPFLFIRTKDYVEGSNPEFDKMMERTYAPPFFNSSKTDTTTNKESKQKKNENYKFSMIINGNRYYSVEDANVKPDEIASVSVLNSESSPKVYGKKAKDGELIMNSEFGKEGPLYIIDGVEVKSVENLKPDDIEKIDVLKGESGLNHYGEKGKNGAVLITTKNQKKSEKVLGNTQVVGNINWINNQKHSSKELTNLLGIKKGDLYSKEIIEERIYDKVSDLYLDNGYLFFNITIAERKKENGIIDLDFTVFEGTQWKIGKIEIAGNKTVSAKEYLKKIEIKSGDLFSRSKLIQSVRTLNELVNQNAEEVDVDVNPLLESQGNEFSLVNLVFKLKEQNGVTENKLKSEISEAEQKFKELIAKELKYPKEALEANIEKYMAFSVRIDKDGNLRRDAFVPEINIPKIIVIGKRMEQQKGLNKTNMTNIEETELFRKEFSRVVDLIQRVDLEELKGKSMLVNVSFKIED
jgi:hypothetical protein